MTVNENHSEATLEGTRVILADDDRQIVELLEYLLVREGAQVACTGSGAEVISVLEQQPADLLLCDIFMPGGDGFEIITWARKHAPDMAIAVMSGGTQMFNGYDSLDLAMDLGARLTIHKPFDLTTLLSQLRQLTVEK